MAGNENIYFGNTYINRKHISYCLGLFLIALAVILLNSCASPKWNDDETVRIKTVLDPQTKRNWFRDSIGFDSEYDSILIQNIDGKDAKGVWMDSTRATPGTHSIEIETEHKMDSSIVSFTPSTPAIGGMPAQPWSATTSVNYTRRHWLITLPMKAESEYYIVRGNQEENPPSVYLVRDPSAPDKFKSSWYSKQELIDSVITAFNYKKGRRPSEWYLTDEKIIEHYSKVIEISPDYVYAYQMRSSAYNRKHDYALAIADCSKAIELDPNNAIVYSNRAFALSKNSEYDQAVADYTKAIDLDNKSETAYNNRGVLYYRKGEYDMAIADYTKAIELDPKYEVAYSNRGSAHYKKDEYNLAISDYSKSLKLDPDDAITLENRADAYKKIGKEDLANADYSKVKEITSK